MSRIPFATTRLLVCCAVFAVLLTSARLSAQEPAADDTAAEEPAAEDTAAEQPSDAPDQAAQPEPKPMAGLIRIAKDSKAWIDLKRKLVVVDGKVVLREGQLEMFACPGNTKSHESIVSVDAKAYVIHAALLAVGAKVGQPVQFAPEYVPASGTEVDIYVLWVDENKKRHKAKAQDWIRQVTTGKPMPYTWVFAGSGFWVDEQTGERRYMAEDGDLICVSNFSTATLDLPVESSQSNDALMFDALTENIPPLGTPVRLILIPREEKTAPEKAGADKPDKPAAPAEDAPPASASGDTGDTG